MVTILHFGFWPQEAKKVQKSNKFYIFDRTKHNSKNFSILYFIIPK